MSTKTTPATGAHDALLRLTLSAMFLAIGLILPFFTGQIREIGNMLLPMHIPVLLCGLICGWQYGGVVGFTLPLLRSFLFGMPLLYPHALSMAVELSMYGFCIGLIYGFFRKQSLLKNILAVYAGLIPAMIVGRIAWGGMQVLLLGLKDKPFGWTAFATGAFLNAIPGIILQLVLVPAVMALLHATGIHRPRRKGERV